MADDVGALVLELRSVQARLVAALQGEFFCDDVTPPEECWGWDEGTLRTFFESGGETKPAGKAEPVDITPAGGDADIYRVLGDAGLSHLCSSLATFTFQEAEAKLAESRPKLLTHLKNMGVSNLTERTKLATALSKAIKESKMDLVKEGQPGGGRAQPEEMLKLDPVESEAPGRLMKEVMLDVVGYQKSVLSYGIPLRAAGLFPPDDKLLHSLVTLSHKAPFTKGLPQECAQGGAMIATTDNGWCSGESACEHGMDLRMFIKPGFDEKTLECAAARLRAPRAPLAACRMRALRGGISLLARTPAS